MLVDRLDWINGYVDIPDNMSVVQLNISPDILYNASWTDGFTQKCMEIVVKGLHPIELIAYTFLLFIAAMLLYLQLKKRYSIDTAIMVPAALITIYASVFSLGYFIALILFGVIVAHEVIDKNA